MVGPAVDQDASLGPSAHLGEVVLRNIGADPFSPSEGQREDRARRRSHVADLKQARTDDAGVRSEELSVGKLLPGFGEVGLIGAKLCLRLLDVFDTGTGKQ